MNRWTLTLAGLRGEPWPPLPALPGTVHRCHDDGELTDLPDWALLPAAELARREGITRQGAHLRIRKARTRLLSADNTADKPKDTP